MKKLHVSIISLAAIALLAISASCICASENADVLTVGDVGFTITDRVISVDNETGKILVEFNYEINPNGKDISNTKVDIYQIEGRLGGESYKWIGEEEINPNTSSGSFVKELDLNEGYFLNLYYHWDGVDWDTYGYSFYY